MHAALHHHLEARVEALVALYRHIARERMDGVPILHPDLAVHAEGFEAEADGRAALGVLVTPWFMNLVRLPLHDDVPMAAPGVMRSRAAGCTRMDFIGAHEPGFGAYEACSLFSPMADFVDQAAAVATARAVLEALRQPPPPAVAPPTSRRALLFGRDSGVTR